MTTSESTTTETKPSQSALDQAAQILAVADHAEDDAHAANTLRVINCPNESQGLLSLALWRRQYPHVDPEKARVEAVARLLDARGVVE